MADISQITSIPGTNLSESDLRGLEVAVGRALPADVQRFFAGYGYASFSDVGFAYIKIGEQNSAFGQFYGKRPGVKFDPYDFNSGALRLGDAKSHYPENVLIFAGDELGGEYFLRFYDDSWRIYWMIYGPHADYEKVCDSFSEFVHLIQIDPYDDE